MALIDRPGNKEIQLDLFLDYASNVKLYPKFQEYFRKWKPPLLAIWGKRDPFFVPAGAAAYMRDNPNAIVQMLDTGHFATETRRRNRRRDAPIRKCGDSHLISRFPHPAA